MAITNTEPTIAKIKFVIPPYDSTKVSSIEDSMSTNCLIMNPLKLAAACMMIENDKLLVL